MLRLEGVRGPATLDWLSRVTWLRGLIIEYQVGDVELAALEPLSGLELLYLQSHAVTEAGIVRLETLRSLTDLTLRCPSVSDSAMSSVARLERLTDLDVRGRVTGQGLERLRTLPCLDSLTVELEGPFLDETATAVREFRAARPEVGLMVISM